jgi:hypothetical protein
MGQEVAVGQQVAEGGQAGGGALEDGDTGGPEGGRLDRVGGRGQVGDHRHRLPGGGGGLDGQAGVAGVGGRLGGQVQVEGEDGGGRVVEQGPDAGGEDLVGVVAGAPGVQGVGGGQAGLEHGRQRLAGRRRDSGQRDPELLGQVEQVGPFAARVVDGGQPAGMGLAPGQQLAGVGQLVEGGHLGDTVGVEQGLVGTVLAGQGAGVGGHHRPGRLAPPDLEGDHRDGLGGRLGQGGPERRRLPDRLQEQGHHPDGGQPQGVVEVGGGAGDELIAGRHDQVEVEPAVVVEQGREHRTGVADHRHRAGGQVGRLRIATHAQALVEVEEPHAVATAHRHPGRPGDGREALGKGCPRRVGLREAAGEDDGRRDAPVGGRPELGLEGGVGDGQHGQVDWPGQVGQGAVAGAPGHLPVAGVDEVDRPPVATGEQLTDQRVPERPGPGARPPTTTTTTDRGSSRAASGGRPPRHPGAGRADPLGSPAALGPPAVGQDGLDGLPPGDAADPAAAVGGRAGLVEPGDRAAVVGVAGGRAHVEQLVGRELGVEAVAPDQPPLLLHLPGPDDLAVQDRALEVGASSA